MQVQITPYLSHLVKKLPPFLKQKKGMNKYGFIKWLKYKFSHIAQFTVGEAHIV